MPYIFNMEVIRRDLRILLPLMVLSIAIGLMLLMMCCVSLDCRDSNPDLSSFLCDMYFRSIGAIPAMISSVGCVLVLLIAPKINGMKQKREDLYPHVVALLMIPAGTEAVLWAVHNIMSIAILGNTSQCVWLFFGYGGMYMLSIAFEGVAMLGYAISKDGKKCAMFACGLNIFFLLMSIIGMLSHPYCGGMEWAQYFFYLTPLGFVDTGSLYAMGSAGQNLMCVWKYLGLLVFLVATYLVAHFYCRAKDNY